MDLLMSSNSSGHHHGGDGGQTSRERSSSTPPPWMLPSSSKSTQKCQYKVLLSFKGKTHRRFTDLLYYKLVDAHFSVFRDKNGLLVGEKCENELPKEIKQFKILILIISPDYAVDGPELVKILKCQKKFGQLVLLIFYRVNPSDLQKQLDFSEKESQARKRRKLDKECVEDVQERKTPLREESDLTRLKIADGDDSKLVKIVAAEVLKTKSTLVVGSYLVGDDEDHVGTIVNMVNVDGCNGGPPNSSRMTSSQQGIKYSVFLNFRGADTRNNFTCFLYDKLERERSDVYMDSKEIPAAADIHKSLMEAIENSSIAVTIFSRDYGSSKSCLRELRKIYECRNRVGKFILPIFYLVEPSDVGNQTGPFKRSFRRHQMRGVCSKELDDWREALKEIAGLKGHTISKNQDLNESMDKIVLDIINILRQGGIDVPEYLVGMDLQVQEVVEKLQVASKDVKVLGICGMSGAGKTTLATVVYNKLYSLYKYHAFISNIEERYQIEGPSKLQYEMISQLLKKDYVRGSLDENRTFIRHRFSSVEALIVLDSVESSEHVKTFARDLLGFGPGSRIIITTKNAGLIDNIKDAVKHPMRLLNDSDSLELFCWHAFRRGVPMEEYCELSEKIASCTGGHPSVIETAGCYLYVNRDQEGRWKETLQLVESGHHKEMQTLLSKCYEHNLDEYEQEIFLDIACFLERKSKTIAHYMWDACCVYPYKGVDKLLHLSLLKIGAEDELLMTYPVRQFGKDRVKKENPKKPALRSRLWSHRESLEALREKGPEKKIQALCLKFDSSLTESFTSEEFNGLPELRFLSLDKVKITGDFENLFPNLRWLDLSDCSDALEEPKNLSLEKLLILDISRSNIRQDWQGWRQIMEKAKDLKVLVLASCENLQGSPTFTDRMRLERLCFLNCQKLRRINMCPNALESLVYLNLKLCPHVNELPKGSLEALKELIIDGTSITKFNARTLGLKNLATLSASKCKGLTTIDESIGNLKSLTCLMLDETAIESLPNSIGSLRNLQNLSLRKCSKLHALPKSIKKLRSLTQMDLSDTAIKELPPSVECLKLLKVLLMGNTHIDKFPESITKLERLEKIDFSSCSRMGGRIPDAITNLSSLTTFLLPATAISSLPDDISGLSHLQVLNLWECKGLKDLPRLPASLTTLHVGSGELKKIPGPSITKELVELHLADNTGPRQNISNEGSTKLWPADSFQLIPNLPKLETLELRISKITELPVNFSVLNNLRKIVLSCPQLQSLPKLPPSLTNLHLEKCKSMTEYDNLPDLTLLSELKICECGGGSIDLGKLGKLRLLEIVGGGQKELSGVEKLHHLRKLRASNCSSQCNLSKLRKRGIDVDICNCEVNKGKDLKLLCQ